MNKYQVKLCYNFMNSYSGYILNNFMNKYFIRVKIKNYLMNRYLGILNDDVC